MEGYGSKTVGVWQSWRLRRFWRSYISWSKLEKWSGVWWNQGWGYRKSKMGIDCRWQTNENYVRKMEGKRATKYWGLAWIPCTSDYHSTYSIKCSRCCKPVSHRQEICNRSQETKNESASVYISRDGWILPCRTQTNNKRNDWQPVLQQWGITTDGSVGNCGHQGSVWRRGNDNNGCGLWKWKPITDSN